MDLSMNHATIGNGVPLERDACVHRLADDRQATA